jgi:hypothetical protein
VLGLTQVGEQTLRHDPILTLAAGLEALSPDKLETVVAVLRDALRAVVTRNAGRAFGACYTCRHFRMDGGTGSGMPHHCALLDEPLSESDSRAICVEQDAVT